MMTCEYCKDSVVMPIKSPSKQYKYIAIGSDGAIRLLNDYTVTRELAQANYCFHCGEKLGGNEQWT